MGIGHPLCGARLSQTWPTARVTVFAEGDHEVHDWLWTRVRDLVALRSGSALTEEMAQRALRGQADLAILDVPEAPDVDRCRAWLQGSDHVIVRSSLDQRAPDGRVMCGWHWTRGADEGPAPLIGSDRVLVTPGCAKAASERGTPTEPARKLLIRLDGATREDELLVVGSLKSIVAGFETVHILTSSRFGVAHRRALAKACPGIEVVGGRGRLFEFLSRSDLAITKGADLRHTVAACGVPQLLIAGDADDAVGAVSFAASGAAEDLGLLDDLSALDLGRRTLSLAEDVPSLAAAHLAARAHVDGLGYQRLLRETLLTHPDSATHGGASLHRVEATKVEGDGVGPSEQSVDDFIVSEIDHLETV